MGKRANQRMNSDATLALRAKAGCAGYAYTLGHQYCQRQWSTRVSQLGDYL